MALVQPLELILPPVHIVMEQGRLRLPNEPPLERFKLQELVQTVMVQVNLYLPHVKNAAEKDHTESQNH